MELEAGSEVPPKRVKEDPDWRKEEEEEGDEEITRWSEWEGRKGGEIIRATLSTWGRETRRRKRR